MSTTADYSTNSVRCPGRLLTASGTHCPSCGRLVESTSGVCGAVIPVYPQTLRGDLG